MNAWSETVSQEYSSEPYAAGRPATRHTSRKPLRLARMARAAAIVSLSLVVASCTSSPVRYVHPNADFGALQKVAVLPFENVSGVQGASDKAHKIFLVELLSLEAFEVVEPGRVAKALKGETVASPDQLAPEDLMRIGKALGADALFMGQVLDYSEARGTGAAPSVTIQLRLVEVSSGATVWSSSQTRAGV